MRRVLPLLLLLSLVACGGVPPPTPPTPPTPDPTWPQQCRDIYHQELGLEPGQYPDEWVDECVVWFASGLTGGEVRELARQKEIPTPPAPPALEPVILQRRPVTADGFPWVWRGVTSFRLAHQIATDEIEAARAWMADVADRGFNVVRVLSTAVHLFDLSPVDGRLALEVLFAEAARAELYVNIVAVVDSADREYDWRAHARQVAVICAEHANCLYEFANEPYHGTQDPDLHDPADAEREAETAVAGLEALTNRWIVGPGPVDEAPEPDAGAALSRHLSRARDMLNQARHYKDVLELIHATGKYLIGNEPTGANERAADVDPGDPADCDRTSTGGQRFWCPAFFAALGFFEAGWGGGGTFHLQAGLRGTAWGPDQSAAAALYLEAGRLIPDHERGVWTFFNAGWNGSPVTNPGGSSAFEDPLGGPIIRAFSFVHGNRGFVGILHRPVTYPAGVLDIGNGWRLGARILELPQFIIFALERE